MRRTIFFGAIISFSLLIASGSAQSPAATNQKQLLALIKEVHDQQAQLLENQIKIETKVGEIAENIRVARIFSERSN
jgi:hypothetical protein